METKKIKLALWNLVAIIGLNLAYTIVIANEFDYMGFKVDFNYNKLILGSFFTLILLICSFLVKDEFIYSIWNIIFLYFFCGELIFYQYNPNSSLIQPTLIAILLFVLLIFSYFKVFITGKVVKDNVIDSLLTYIAIILFLPFLIFYYKYINIKNLLLIDVYQTRALFRNIHVPLIGYLEAPLVRVLLPTLIVKNVEYKKYIKVFLFLSMILYIYLAGALKSVFFGLLAIFFFYRGSLIQKAKNFTILISFFTYIGILFWLIFDNVFLVDSFIRRVFFVPPYLNNIYIDYFTDNYTFLQHSPLGMNLAESVYDTGQSFSRYFGENIMGLQGFNANVGLITEGYISFGYLGGAFFALIIALIILYLKVIRFDPKYFGILFVYVYYFNTSFLSVLLLTHGLFFFLLFSYFFLRKEQYDLNK